MDKLKYKLAIFMQGRYGPDELYRGCAILYLILLVLNIFIRASIPSRVISAISGLLVIWVFFRFFSKNIAARQRENSKYLIIKRKFKNGFASLKKRFSDKQRVYRRCRHCKAQLRFPRKKGVHNAVCPKCKKNIKVRILF